MTQWNVWLKKNKFKVLFVEALFLLMFPSIPSSSVIFILKGMVFLLFAFTLFYLHKQEEKEKEDTYNFYLSIEKNVQNLREHLCFLFGTLNIHESSLDKEIRQNPHGEKAALLAKAQKIKQTLFDMQISVGTRKAEEDIVAVSQELLYSEEHEASTRTPLESSSPSHTSGKMHPVLVVDDESFCNQIISHSVQRLGYPCVSVKNGFEALKLCEKKPFSLILMDINMPKMNGWETSEKIRKRFGKKAPPIVAITSLSGSQDIQKSQSVGMQEFLCKPLDIKALKQTLLKFIGPPPQTPQLKIQEESVDPQTTQNLSHLFNTEKILEYCGNSEQLFYSSIKISKEANEETFSLLKKALEANNTKDIHFYLHKLKGNFQFLGCERAVKICNTLKKLTSQNELKAKTQKVQSYLKELSNLIAVIDALKVPKAMAWQKAS